MKEKLTKYLLVLNVLMLLQNTGCNKITKSIYADLESEKSISYNIPKGHRPKTIPESVSLEEEIDNIIEITMSFAGDCTLGEGHNFGYYNSFTSVFDEVQDYSYFLKNVVPIFENDDYTIVNLEGVLSDTAKSYATKQFIFKGPTAYTNILTSSSVEAVTIANNHIMDYLSKGYEDTKEALDEAQIVYFGGNTIAIENIKGIDFGFVGISFGNKSDIDKSIAYLNEKGIKNIIFYFHWGIERDYKQNSQQESLARYAIDNGATLVVGAHPTFFKELSTIKINILYIH